MLNPVGSSSIAGATDASLAKVVKGDQLTFNGTKWTGYAANRHAIRPRHVVASRGQTNKDGLTTAAAYTSATARFKFNAAVSCSDLSAVFGNWDWSTHADLAGVNTMTVKAAIEYPYGAAPSTPGAIYPLHFNGARTATLDPGGTLFSDPLGIEMTAGDLFGVRVYYSTGAGSPQFVAGLAVLADNQGCVHGSDLCDSGTVTNVTEFAFGPVAIIGTTQDPTLPSVGVLGDSIASGTGDTVLQFGYGGMYVRAFGTVFAATMPYMMMALSGHAFSMETSAGARKFRAAIYPLCKHWISQLGINDYGTDTLLQLQTAAQTVWNYLKQRGAHVWQTTMLPHTTSTDAWATTANQTPTANELVRTGFNDWIRTNWQSLGLEGYLEVADQGESARNSGRWAVSGGLNAAGTSITGAFTADGIHPTAYGHGIASGAIILANFT